MAVDSGGQKLLLPLLLLLPAATVAQNPYCDISTSHTMCQVSLNFVINFFFKKNRISGRGKECAASLLNFSSSTAWARPAAPPPRGDSTRARYERWCVGPFSLLLGLKSVSRISPSFNAFDFLKLLFWGQICPPPSRNSKKILICSPLPQMFKYKSFSSV